MSASIYKLSCFFCGTCQVMDSHLQFCYDVLTVYWWRPISTLTCLKTSLLTPVITSLSVSECRYVPGISKLAHVSNPSYASTYDQWIGNKSIVNHRWIRRLPSPFFSCFGFLLLVAIPPDPWLCQYIYSLLVKY